MNQGSKAIEISKCVQMYKDLQLIHNWNESIILHLQIPRITN